MVFAALLFCAMGCGTPSVYPAAPQALPPDGTAGNCAENLGAPAAARGAGYRRLSFCDDFETISTIDLDATGAPGFKWYTNVPFRDQKPNSRNNYSVANSALTVVANLHAAGWGLSTMDPITGSGKAWKFGYFEARISLDPSLASKSVDHPAFWSVSAYATLNHTYSWSELDFFEAPKTAPSSEFAGTLHDWRNFSVAGGVAPGYKTPTDIANSNYRQPVNIDWTRWHVVGTLWEPGMVTWYWDGVALMTQRYSAGSFPVPAAQTWTGGVAPPVGTFAGMDQEQMGQQIILGSGPGWPLIVDWVRVWQKDQQ
ncbi:MAG TPA: hypothetical protein VHX13_06450 [Acidobacteriaceae bacterium]|jgi:hypothetical protein|nr:hypothetical protein [Acidobacteriaceae bacterium]